MENEVRTPGVSQIHFTPVRPRSGLLGFIQFVLDDTYVVGGVGVHTRLDSEGVRLVYPQKTLVDGSIVSLFHPLSREVGQAIERSVYVCLKDKIPVRLV